MNFKTWQAEHQCPMELKPFHEWRFPDGEQWAQFYRFSDGFVIRFPELADFRISQDGLTLQAWPAPGISHGTVDHLYLNQVIPLALSIQGRWVFHGSACEAPAGVLAFLADSGRGKSTLAASFATAGYRFLSDDALLLEPAGGGGFEVQPSHPSIRLWRDSQEALVGVDAQLAPSVQYTSKARVLSGGKLGFCPESQPLRRMYFLGDGSAPGVQIERMTPREAVMGLVKNSFLLDIEAPDVIALHFNRLANMAELPIYYRLDYPRSYNMLPAVRQAIVEHATAEYP